MLKNKFKLGTEVYIDETAINYIKGIIAATPNSDALPYYVVTTYTSPKIIIRCTEEDLERWRKAYKAYKFKQTFLYKLISLFK